TVTFDNFKNLHEYKNFSKIMQDLNYEETKKKMEDGIAAYTDLKDDYYYKKLVAFYEGLPAFVEKNLAESLEKDRASAAEKMNRELVETGIAYCTDINKLFPQFSVYKEMLAKFEDLNQKFEKYMNENVYTSEFHKKHVNQVLLSNKPIVIGQEKEEDFKTTFKAGESVYAIWYMDGHQEPRYRYQLFINESVQEQSSYFTGSAENKSEYLSYYTFAIIPDPDQPTPSPTGYEALRVTEHILSSLRVRGQFADKKIKVSFGTKKLEFEIDYSDGLAAFEAKFKKIKKKRASEIRIPKPNTGNAEIAAAWKKAVLNPGETVVMISTLDAGWQYAKNRAGIVTSRYANVWGVIKTKSGECVLLGGTVSQEKTPSGYGEPGITLASELYGDGSNYYSSMWDGVKRAYETEGFECDCNLVGK
ncbi:MAG TPA: hypothetical protein VD905_21625, partial [Flavobacteriales bacterium]|nr:hypothetical protein [Flavobacteriales bacterium]